MDCEHQGVTVPTGTIHVIIKGEIVELDLAEANNLLVGLAKAINNASANSAMKADPKEVTVAEYATVQNR